MDSAATFAAPSRCLHLVLYGPKYGIYKTASSVTSSTQYYKMGPTLDSTSVMVEASNTGYATLGAVFVMSHCG